MQFGTNVIKDRFKKFFTWFGKQKEAYKQYREEEDIRNKKEIGLLKQRVEIKKLKTQLKNVGTKPASGKDMGVNHMQQMFGGDNYSIGKPSKDFTEAQYIR